MCESPSDMSAHWLHTEESEDNALVQADAKDDDWGDLKKEILDSMPDDPEEESDDEALHVHGFTKISIKFS